MFEIKYDKNGQPLPTHLQPPMKESPVDAPPTGSVSPDQQSVDDGQQVELQAEVEAAPQEPHPVVEEKKQEEGHQPKNFKELREAKRRIDQENIRIQKERDEALRRIRELEERYSKPSVSVAAQEEDIPDIQLGPDDLAEGKHLSSVQKQIKKLEQQLNYYQARSSETVIENRLRNEYPDFDKVVSPDNIESLRLAYPEIANTINNSSTDLYSKAVSAYAVIKNLGIHTEDTYGPDRQKALKNAAKPKVLASISPASSDTPLSRANAFADAPLTDDIKKQIYKDMLAAARRSQ